jgi:hypothetical protein
VVSQLFNLSGGLVFLSCQHFPLNLFCFKHGWFIKVEAKTWPFLTPSISSRDMQAIKTWKTTSQSDFSNCFKVEVGVPLLQLVNLKTKQESCKARRQDTWSPSLQRRAWLGPSRERERDPILAGIWVSTPNKDTTLRNLYSHYQTKTQLWGIFFYYGNTTASYGSWFCLTSQVRTSKFINKPSN